MKIKKKSRVPSYIQYDNTSIIIYIIPVLFIFIVFFLILLCTVTVTVCNSTVTVYDNRVRNNTTTSLEVLLLLGAPPAM